MGSSNVTESSSTWTVQVIPRRRELDAQGRDHLSDVQQHASLAHIRDVRSSMIYLLQGALDEPAVERIAERLLADPVVHTYVVRRGLTERGDDGPAVEVHHQPGVMDPVALSTGRAIADLLEPDGSGEAGFGVQVRTARRYVFDGARNAEELERIGREVLANDCIESVFIDGFGRHDPLPDTFPEAPQTPVERREVPVRSLDREALRALSRRAHLFLCIEEMEAIRDHFTALGRDPTDLELETLAQTWSEHCVHKTLKSDVVYRGADFGRGGEVEVRFDNLLKSTIMHATRQLNRPWCLSVFDDNAGVVEFDEEYGVAFKVETHNHPSAIEPYGGAATGVGGCIRDILGCGLGARPIANTDVFCLARPDYPDPRLPKGVLHPRRVLKGVVGGVRDYGNRMGIPTVNGAIHFDERYLANPLVFCGCVGLIPKRLIHKAARPGDKIVVAGGRTGRDGIHGATFSSAELTDTHADEFSHAVQIGNAIEEKKLLDAMLLARDYPSGPLFSAVTDCGAGGLSSAVGEMGAERGAAVDLDQVPLKYAGLRYDEIWISEAQERMVFAVPPENLERLLAIFRDEHVEATVIGEFTGDGVLRVRYRGQTVGELDVRFLHYGRPRVVRQAVWRGTATGKDRGATAPTGTATVRERPDGNGTVTARERPTASDEAQGTGDAAERPTTADRGRTAPGGSSFDIGEQLLQQMASPNVASKEWVIRQYDHEVQGGSVVKPLCGPGAGPSDAAVIRPRLDGYRGIAIGCGLCPQRSDEDPYWMAVAAVDEALRNVICVGADPQRTSILDNFCWGGVDDPESLGELVRACKGAHDAAVAYGLPFISGKDSLNNRFSQSADEAERCNLPQRISIPGTLLISALGMIDDVRRCVTPDLKQPGARLIYVSAPADRVGLAAAWQLHAAVAAWIREGWVLSAHDVSDGGVAVAAAEMCIAGELGARIRVESMGLDGDAGEVLFAEPMTAYVLECRQAALPLLRVPAAKVVVLGTVQPEPSLVIERGQQLAARLPVEDLARAWRSFAP